MTSEALHPYPRGLRGRNGHASAAPNESCLPVTLLLISLAIPWLIPVGPLVLSIYRLFLLAITGPCLVMWFSGRAGRVRIADIAVLCFCLWSALALWVVHDEGVALEAGGVLFLETFGAYLVARCYVRSARQFVQMIRTTFIIIACLTPFAFIEMTTGVNVARAIFSSVLPTYQPDTVTDMRAGMTRAMVIFEHPILFGLFAGSMLALVHMGLGMRDGIGLRWLRSGIVCVATGCSLSSGPLGILVMQIALIAWDRLLRSNPYRWHLIWALAGLAYLGIDLASNQSPIQFYISRLTFSQESAWYRFLIWDYGTASIMNHPLFGVGFGEWERPSYMSTSFDMFWLILPLRHGMPAGFFIYVAFAAVYFGVMFKRLPDPELGRYRAAYLITLTAFFLIGWAVHLWGATYVLLFLLLGAGGWFLDQPRDAEPQGLIGEGTPTTRHRSGAAVPVRRRLSQGGGKP
ncbi:O-antigen ligase family protein [Devosia geojensis]|uniref:O-antigen ligase family protein n=1 Tax=Devosia geojensis TaxID=443610 RepID=UPI000698FF6F|nr:O-antigen ligase family protein [Devosia geojensis]